MADYPCCTVVGKLKPFFEKIKTLGIPTKVDMSWLKTIGLTSSNDRTILNVLRTINFIEVSGVPTENWKAFRVDKSVLAQGIREGYSDLFNLYPDANSQTKSDLTKFFSTKTSAGSQVIGKIVSTFTELCTLADFSGQQFSSVSKTKEELASKILERPEIKPLANKMASLANNNSNGLIINLNIQLTVPETTDESVYEKFFSAMKKHLLS